MTETLREVSPDLWVSDAESAGIVGDDFDFIVDCTGRGPTRGNGKTVSIRPSGSTSHTWTEGNLTTIASVVSMKLEAGKSVLIHCERGISRSVTAAAAVLLWMDRANTVSQAVTKTRWAGRAPASQSLGSLKKWWAAQQAKSQPGLFEQTA